MNGKNRSDMDRKEMIEIPFGAKDSELKGWEYTIPEGMEAIIKDGKVIVREKESEDERVRKCIGMALTDVDEQRFKDFGTTLKNCLSWLEKQKAKERMGRMAPIYNDRESFEEALEKAWKDYNDSGARTVDGCEDDYVECAHAKGFREGYLFGFEKQKEQKPAEWSEEDEIKTAGGYKWKYIQKTIEL